MEHSVTTADGASGGQMWPGRVSAVLAVKHLRDAKSRLAATLPAPNSTLEPTAGHAGLVLAMLLDTITALTSAGVDQILVVSPDEDVLAGAHGAGVHSLREPDTDHRDIPPAGLNRAFDDGARCAREAWPESSWVMLIQADLPAANPASLVEVIEAAEELAGNTGHEEVLLADRDGSGTVLLLRRPSCTDPPRFGVGSAAAHRRAGAVELDPGGHRWPDLRTDVDTADDLAAAAALGLGAATSTALGHVRRSD